MYFKSRVEAGDLLADQLILKYHAKNSTVVALNDGAVMVGAQIAIRLRCALTMLLTAPMLLPRENTVVAAMNQEGNLTYNTEYSQGELEEMQSEYRTFIEEERIRLVHNMNNLLGAGGLIRRDLLQGHNVILVSDGLNSTFPLDSAADFLKPIRIEKLIVATPLANVPAVDRMHILADEIYCLDVVSDYLTTDHYYEAHDVPDHDTVIKTLESVVSHWNKPTPPKAA
jgi:putative phosphoribosyl transferase